MSLIPNRLRREFNLDLVEEVTFTQITAEAFHYRDSVRFSNGRHVLLQSINEGVRFEVLAPASDPENAVQLLRPMKAGLAETRVPAQPS